MRYALLTLLVGVILLTGSVTLALVIGVLDTDDPTVGPVGPIVVTNVPLTTASPPSTAGQPPIWDVATVREP